MEDLIDPEFETEFSHSELDKEDAWEGIELERLLSLEDKLDEEELPAEVYSLKDSWF